MKRDSAEGSDALDGKRQRPCDIVPASYGGYSVGGSCAGRADVRRVANHVLHDHLATAQKVNC